MVLDLVLRQTEAFSFGVSTYIRKGRDLHVILQNFSSL